MKKLLYIFLLFPLPVFAAVPESGDALDEIILAYKTASSAWEPIIKGYAYRLFWLLVAIDFSWGAMKLAIEKSEFESFWAFAINRVMTIGFFLALISFGSTWSKTIIDSFRELASAAGGSPTVNPSGVMGQGLTIAKQLIVNGLSWNPVSNLGINLTAFCIVIIYALIAAELIFVLVSMWLVLYAGIIMLALGGSEWTRSYALNYYKTILAIGVKLFVLQLLVAIGSNIIGSWTSNLDNSTTMMQAFVIAGCALMLYVLVKGIGGLVESLITGSGAASASGSGAIMAAAAAGAGAVAGVATGGAAAAQSAMGAYQATSAASALASMRGEANGPSGVAQSMASLGSRMGGERGESLGQSLGGAFDSVAGTVKEAASAYGQDYSARVKGESSSQYGTTGGRMANRINDKIAEAGIGGEDSGSQGNYISGVDMSNLQEAPLDDASSGLSSVDIGASEADAGDAPVNKNLGTS